MTEPKKSLCRLRGRLGHTRMGTAGTPEGCLLAFLFQHPHSSLEGLEEAE